MLPQIKIRKGAEKEIQKGAFWIYDNQIEQVTGGIQKGDICEAFSWNGKFLGRGFYNAESVISFRIISKERVDINKEYFRKKILDAIEYRKKLGLYECCRLIYAESDGIPAFIVDKYNEYLSIQMLSYGIEQIKEMLIDLLVETVQPKGIYERDDVPIRIKEGLEEKTGVLYGEVPDAIIIHENEVKMYVDVKNGQKTGYFLDQKENRAAIKPYVKDAEVLDCFCHTGGFSVHAAYYGAKHVTSVDISEEALSMAQKNMELNGFSNADFVCANVFDFLHEATETGKQYDTIILDPPGFIKNRRAFDKGRTGYKEINLRAMKLVKSGGFLLTYSCSQLMTPELFLDVLKEAASDIGRTTRIVEIKMQAKDHPALINQAQPLYLKCYVLQIV